ncbi:MAG TPA: hypothetical protein PLJ08_20005 [Cyclobacteriaceae bacterium]|nr:hypothetical protein [Cyclobacteriaceae bacterium]
MKKRHIRHLDLEIDKLTNSIENSLTGEVFDTAINQLSKTDLKTIKKSDWVFNWGLEFRTPKNEVYKLTTVNNPTIIQGLLSIEDKDDHIFMHLIESAKFNKGKDKVYLGVPGNLVAFACKVSLDKGYDGYVAFDSKTVLIEHYKQILGATHLIRQRMFVDPVAAQILITRYFKD